MAEDSGEDSIKTSTIASEQKIPNKWAKQAAKAAADLKRNNMILEDAAPTGLASDNTLRARGYVSGPQGGEKLTPQSVKSELVTVKK
jgi:hypothetical protein